MSPGLGGFAGGLAKGISQGAGLAMMKRQADRADKAAEQESELRGMQIDEAKRKQASRDAIRNASKAAFESTEGGAEDRFLAAADAGWKAAIEHDDLQTGMDLFTKASVVREKLRTQALENADRLYTTSGDVSPYLDVFNRYGGAGFSLELVGKNDDGSIEVATLQNGERLGEPTRVKKEEISMWVEKLRDPSAMRQLEMNYANEYRKQRLKTQSEIEVERAKGEEARKTERVKMEGRDRFQFVTQKDADGNETVYAGDKRSGGLQRVSAGGGQSGSPAGVVRKDLPVINEIRKSGLKRWGEVDRSGMTNDWTHNERSARLTALAERLYLGNRHLPPETVNNLVEKGQHGYATIEENGQRMRVEVIKVGDKYYRLADEGGEQYEQGADNNAGLAPAR